VVATGTAFGVRSAAPLGGAAGRSLTGYLRPAAGTKRPKSWPLRSSSPNEDGGPATGPRASRVFAVRLPVPTNRRPSLSLPERGQHAAEARRFRRSTIRGTYVMYVHDDAQPATRARRVSVSRRSRPTGAVKTQKAATFPCRRAASGRSRHSIKPVRRAAGTARGICEGFSAAARAKVADGSSTRVGGGWHDREFGRDSRHGKI
jgi:hypothetical protein